MSSTRESEFVNYYQVLGVKNDATQQEITEAYRALSLKNHPDKNRSAEATEKTKLLNHARDVLLDPSTRKEHDLAIEKKDVSSKARKARKHYGFESSSNFRESQQADHLFDDIFESESATKSKKTRRDDQEFKVGLWRAELRGMHLFIYHPKLQQGGKNNISFYNIHSPKIGLPINFDEALHKKLRTQLMPHITECEQWHYLQDQQCEILLALPGDRKKLDYVLDIIFKLYDIPDEMSRYIKIKLGISSNYECEVITRQGQVSP